VPTDPEDESLQGETKPRELSRRARLLELASGQKMLSATEALLLFVIAALFVFVFLRRAQIPMGAFELFSIVILMQVLHTGRVHKRLKAIIQLIELQENK
ncbi:MAG: hypothetical protein ACM338_05765, partial [Betaproteobacteria bacterium]